MGLRIVGQFWISHDRDKLREHFDIFAKQNWWGLNLHLGTGLMTVAESVEMVRFAQQLARERNIFLLLETHRGRLTQDLLRTTEWLEQAPETRFTLDISHYVVASEGCAGDEPLFWTKMDAILQRTSMIHGRIGNGQQVQVHVDPAKNKPFQLSLFKQAWTRAMAAFRRNARPNDVLLFTPELGPPGYAITDLSEREFSDRWDQSLVLAGLAQECWKASASDTAKS